MIVICTDTPQQYRPRSNNERMGQWAAKFYGLGHHKHARLPSRSAGHQPPKTSPPGR